MVVDSKELMGALAPSMVSFSYPCSEQSASSLLAGANYLTPAVDAKLHAICHGMDLPQPQPQTQSNATTTTMSTTATNTPSPFFSSESPVVKSEPVCSASESSSSADGDVSSTGSSDVVPEMQLLDFSEAPWDESESFLLHKYPSLEIDWDAILS